MDNTNDEISRQLKRLRDEYLEKLPEKLQAIRTLWNNVSKHWDAEELAELHRHLHTIKGSGSTFGLNQITDTASIIDAELKHFIKDTTARQTDNIVRVTTLIDQLETDYIDNAKSQDHFQNKQEFADLAHKTDTRINIALVLGDIPVETSLAEELKEFTYEVHILKDAQYIELKTSKQSAKQFHAVVLDMDTTAQCLSSQKVTTPQLLEIPLPIIAISSAADLQQRLLAVRNGASVFLDKPIDISFLVDCIDRLTHNTYNDPFKVMIIDDSKSLAHAYAAFLQHAGIKTHVLDDPLNALDSMVQFNPDLVLLDLYMPRCNGIELARVIRQHPSFSRIPIVFLSAESNVDRQLDVMSMGGDDFLTKPIQASHLISATTTRIERYRELRKFMERDSLTGLYNRGKIQELLDIEIARANREQQKLSLAIIDIDHFKSINDNYGHSIGDKTLKSLSRALAKALRKTDIVGRYGGEEFVVIFPNTAVSQATTVLDRIREQFSAIEHVCETGKFFVTFSCGVAGYPQHCQPSALSVAADEVLYEAKNSGRNKVLAA